MNSVKHDIFEDTMARQLTINASTILNVKKKISIFENQGYCTVFIFKVSMSGRNTESKVGRELCWK